MWELKWEQIRGISSGLFLTSDVSVTLAICVQPENQRVSEQTQNKREENQTLQFIVDTFGRQIYDIWHLWQETNKWLTPAQEQKRPGKPIDNCSIKNSGKTTSTDDRKAASTPLYPQQDWLYHCMGEWRSLRTTEDIYH